MRALRAKKGHKPPIAPRKATCRRLLMPAPAQGDVPKRESPDDV
jgi:hypothetical protein